MYGIKALQNWKIFLKALSKRLRKLTIKTKRLQWNAGPYMELTQRFPNNYADFSSVQVLLIVLLFSV